MDFYLSSKLFYANNLFRMRNDLFISRYIELFILLVATEQVLHLFPVIQVDTIVTFSKIEASESIIVK